MLTDGNQINKFYKKDCTKKGFVFFLIYWLSSFFAIKVVMLGVMLVEYAN